ncbi:MAG: hypothetical protein LBT14_08750 [Treponema sp.]|nr:hypothetical protein [Treponema sp.]
MEGFISCQAGVGLHFGISMEIEGSSGLAGQSSEGTPVTTAQTIAL